MTQIEGILKLLGGAIFAVSVAVSAGIASIEILGFDLSRVLWENETGRFIVDLSSAISVDLLASVFLTQLPSWSDIKPEYKASIGLTVLLVAAGILDPGFAADNELIGLLAVGVSGGAYWGISSGSCS